MKFWIDFLGDIKFNEIFNSFGEATFNAFELDTSKSDWFNSPDSNSTGVDCFSSFD